MKKIVSILLLTLLAIASFGFILNVAGADGEVEQTWARMHGRISQWGSTPVFGMTNVLVREINTNGTSSQWAMVHAIWSQSPREINCTTPPTENFTYTFYAAKLTNTTLIAFNYSGYALHISGYWDVNEVTMAYYVNENGELISFSCTIVPVVTDAEGNMNVAGDWSTFEINITDIDVLSGVVLMHMIGHMEIVIGDMNGNQRLGIEDLVHVAKAYGSMPGFGNYNFEMDFNFDYQIDIGDLSTIGASIKA